MPTANETNAAITGLSEVLASLELMAACIGSIAPSASAIKINKTRDCISGINDQEQNENLQSWIGIPNFITSYVTDLR